MVLVVKDSNQTEGHIRAFFSPTPSPTPEVTGVDKLSPYSPSAPSICRIRFAQQLGLWALEPDFLDS